MFNYVPSRLMIPTGCERPSLTSYDSGYEHSLEHWTELQRLWRAEDEMVVDTECPLPSQEQVA